MGTLKDIDNLTRDVLAAEKAGMSYGQYKALTYIPEKKVERFVTAKTVVTDALSFNESCVVCGRGFHKRTWNQKTCSEACRDIWNKDYFKTYRESKASSTADK